MDKTAYTTAEAAEKLGVTPARVRQMVISGHLEAEKFGRDLVISAEAVVVAKQRKTKPGPAPKLKESASGKKRGSKT